MEARAATIQTTKDRIIGAMLQLFLERWYDELTLKDVAEKAGVALQTVLNHFASKEGLLAALLEDQRLLDVFAGHRFRAQPGDDVHTVMQLLVADYERAGDAMVRLLALEARAPAVQPMLDMGRIGQRIWLESVFEYDLRGLRGDARERRLDLIVCATDVYTWHILRRAQGHSPAETLTAILEMVEAITR